jgi:hypothetical protein
MSERLISTRARLSSMLNKRPGLFVVATMVATVSVAGLMFCWQLVFAEARPHEKLLHLEGSLVAVKEVEPLIDIGRLNRGSYLTLNVVDSEGNTQIFSLRRSYKESFGGLRLPVEVSVYWSEIVLEQYRGYPEPLEIEVSEGFIKRYDPEQIQQRKEEWRGMFIACLAISGISIGSLVLAIWAARVDAGRC